MNYFQLKGVNTHNHFSLGSIWTFRNCEVQMHTEGFTCNCKKYMQYKCNHIKSVELGLLGVGQTYYGNP